MQDLEELVNSVEDDVFAHRFNDIGGKLPGLIDALLGFAGGVSEKKLPDFNKILEGIVIAQEKCDFLLLADLLEYRLLPFVKTQEGKEARRG